MSVLEVLKLVFMAGVALCRGQGSGIHGEGIMFSVAHDTLRLPNLSFRRQVAIVRLKTGATKTMTIHTLSGKVRVVKYRFDPFYRALAVSHMTGGATLLFGKFGMGFG